MTEQIDQDVLNLVIAGRDAKWPRPSRRIARAQLAQLARIAQKIEGHENGAVTTAGAANFFECANDVLDFMYEFNVPMARGRSHFDDHAEETELMEAFGKISEFVSAPFVGSGTATPSLEDGESPEATE